jgi:hypothetical protein
VLVFDLVVVAEVVAQFDVHQILLKGPLHSLCS